MALEHQSAVAQLKAQFKADIETVDLAFQNKTKEDVQTQQTLTKQVAGLQAKNKELGEVLKATVESDEKKTALLGELKENMSSNSDRLVQGKEALKEEKAEFDK